MDGLHDFGVSDAPLLRVAPLMCWFRKKPTPVPVPVPVLVRPTVGVVVHRLLDEDVAALQVMGVRCVRLSLYPSGEGSQWIDRAVAEGFDVLVVSYRYSSDHAGDAARWPTVLWQIGNEPNWQGVTPAQAAMDTQGGNVTCGIAHGTPTAWIAEFHDRCFPQRMAAHIYGQPLSGAVAGTLAQFPWPDTWITEIGDHNAQELERALRLIDGAKYPRAYVYALWSESDNYTLTPEHQTVIRAFIQGT